MINFATNDFQMKFPVINSPFPGQEAQAEFALDWRQTKDPFIGDKYLDTFFLG